MAGGRPRMVEVGMHKGTLSVIALRHEEKTLYVQCLCGCGKSFWTTSGAFRGKISCKECSRVRGLELRTSHGASKRGLNDPLYRAFRAMHARCYSKNTRAFRWYGAKGIKVCPEWHDFSIFREWAMAHGYQPGLTLDRIKEELDYSPDNCQYLSQSENSKKMRTKYKFVSISAIPVFYDEACFGDF